MKRPIGNMAPTDTRILLVLDLDETLVHVSYSPLAGQAPPAGTMHAVDGFLHIYKRPHLDAFLEIVHPLFDLAVWTAATGTYAQTILSTVFPARIYKDLKFVFAQDKCCRPRVSLFGASNGGGWELLKPLKKVHRAFKYPYSRMLIVDDKVETFVRNYGNAIQVDPFLGDRSDGQLLHLANYLVGLSEVRDVRTIEKRQWCQGTQVT